MHLGIEKRLVGAILQHFPFEGTLGGLVLTKYRPTFLIFFHGLAYLDISEVYRREQEDFLIHYQTFPCECVELLLCTCFLDFYTHAASI